MATALALVEPGGVETYRQSTDAASICRDIVVATASKIGGRQFVAVEGWQAIAVAHGCVASAIDVHRINDDGSLGFAATGVLRRMSDGIEIGRAEGFVGDDEKTWGKRDVYARRAMAQTRAISRVCRSAFAHVVVMMKAGLQTTPAEEVPEGDFEEVRRDQPRQPDRPRTQQQKADAIPEDFDAGAAGFDIDTMFKAAKDKPALDQAWHDTKGLRARIKAVDEHIHAALVKTFKLVADGFAKPQTSDIIADEIPY